MDIQPWIVGIAIVGSILLIAFALSAIIELPNKLDRLTNELKIMNTHLETINYTLGRRERINQGVPISGYGTTASTGYGSTAMGTWSRQFDEG